MLIAVCLVLGLVQAHPLLSDPKTVVRKTQARLRGAYNDGTYNDFFVAADSLTRIEEASCPVRGNLPNFIVHIPKAGGNSAAERLREDMKEICPRQNYADVCNHAIEQLDDRRWDQWMRMGWNCTAHMSESPYFPHAERHFTIVRDPTHHVISQYFHCTESEWRKPTYTEMPEMTDWLDYWVDVRNNGTADATTSNYPLLYTFDCYKPINLQSSMLGGIDSLTSRFDVIGLTSQLDRSICLISIKLLGKVPARCDCSSSMQSLERRVDVNSTIASFRIDHGTIHHGDSFQLSPEQMERVASLTDQDAIVYETAQRYFEQVVKDVEQAYSIVLC